MKSAKLFLYGMYFHLFLSVVVPIGILVFSSNGWNSVGIGLLLFYLAMIVVVQIIGWVCVGMAVAAYQQDKGEKLRNGIRSLKLYSIPFYVVNFLYSFFVWFVLVGASRGILILLVPIPIIITYLMVFQSGCVGICYIMYLRKQPENQGKPNGAHYALQLIPVLDVIGTIIILRKWGR